MSKTGSCLCGQTTYEANGDPIAVALCHCKNCQRQSGAAYSVNAVYLRSALKVQGPIKTFEDLGDNGSRVFRHFCGECGSPINSDPESQPAITALKVGTLDDTSSIKPAVQIWCASAQPWLELNDSIPSLPGDAPS